MDTRGSSRCASRARASSAWTSTRSSPCADRRCTRSGSVPIHASVIEPGHFRFMCHGERVHAPRDPARLPAPRRRDPAAAQAAAGADLAGRVDRRRQQHRLRMGLLRRGRNARRHPRRTRGRTGARRGARNGAHRHAPGRPDGPGNRHRVPAGRGHAMAGCAPRSSTRRCASAAAVSVAAGCGRAACATRRAKNAAATCWIRWRLSPRTLPRSTR